MLRALRDISGRYTRPVTAQCMDVSASWAVMIVMSLVLVALS